MMLVERLSHEVGRVKEADDMLVPIGECLDELNNSRSNTIVIVRQIAVVKDSVVSRNSFSPGELQQF
jgi:hypothetical protein